MNTRFFVNVVRYALENLVPPALRDSRLGYGLLWLYYRGNTRFQTQFRQRVPTMTEACYERYYRTFPGLDTDTDCNARCLAALPALVEGHTVLDAGCGRGYVAELLRRSRDVEVSAIDFIVPDEIRERYPSIAMHAGRIEDLPFDDDAFDTVVCTHTLEHVVDLQAAIRELRRVAARRLVIIVPRERESLFTFNLHVHFFPYPHSFLKHMIPLPDAYHCESVDGDILYWEDRPN